MRGRLPLATLAGELAEVYPDSRTDLAQSFDQWEASIHDGLRAMHQRADFRRSAGPDRLIGEAAHVLSEADNDGGHHQPDAENLGRRGPGPRPPWPPGAP